MALAKKRFQLDLKNALALTEKTVALDPTLFEHEINTYTGRLTKASQRKWKERSDKCAQCLTEADSRLKNATWLTKKYPYLELSEAEIYTIRRALHKEPGKRFDLEKALRIRKLHPDLRGIRGSDALEVLPGPDRKACLEFWKEIDDLLNEI